MKILSARNSYRSPYFKVKNFRCIHMPNICFCFARFNYFIHTYSSNLLVLNFSVFGRSFKKKYKLCAISSLLKFIDGTIENNCEIRSEVFSENVFWNQGLILINVSGLISTLFSKFKVKNVLYCLFSIDRC